MYLQKLKEALVLTVSNLVKILNKSIAQVNRILSGNKDVRRSLDAKGKYIAHIDVVKEKAFQSGIAIIEGHAFSTEPDKISAMAKCINESKWGRSRNSLEDMLRSKDLGKSFKKLEDREDIIKAKLGRKILYLSKENKEEQIQNYYRKKGHLLREKEKEAITIALIFSVLKYNKLNEIESKIHKPRNKGGRKPYPFKAMLNGVIYKVMKKISSFGKVTKELDHDSNLAVALGFDLEQGTPSESCFYKFIQQVGSHTGRNIDKELEALLNKKREAKKKGEKVKAKLVYKKKVKSHKRNYIPLDEVDDEIKTLNKEIVEQKKEIPNNNWYYIFTDLVSQLLTLGIIDGKFICLDATHINASKKDPNTSYGVKRTRKRKDGSIEIIKDFYGYKLHITVDAKTNLPVGITITTGCVADNKEAPKIIRQLKRHGIFFKFFLADGGYNDRKIYSEIAKYNKEAKFICPPAKNEDGSESTTEYYYDPETRQQHKIWYNVKHDRKLFRLRGPTENINKIIKHDLDMDKPRARGIRAIESLAYIHCIAVLVLAIAARITGREHLTNQFSKVV